MRPPSAFWVFLLACLLLLTMLPRSLSIGHPLPGLPCLPIAKILLSELWLTTSNHELSPALLRVSWFL